MHLSPNLEYAWHLQLTDDELTVVQKVLRGDDLTDDEEGQADHLSSTLDLIRPKAERSRNFKGRRRNRPRDSEPHDEDEGYENEDFADSD